MIIKTNTKGRLVKRERVAKSGLPPGSMENIEQNLGNHPIITMFEYNDEGYTEVVLTDLSQCTEALKRPTIKWIDIDGIHHVPVIEEIGKLFKIHPLTLEDIVNPDQRSKFEDFSNYLTCVLRMISYDQCVHSEQLTILLLDNVVLTFQEAHGKDGFDPIRDRIRNYKGRVRKMGADYLAYALLDTVVDTYFSIIESVGDKIEELEDEVIGERLHKELIADIHTTKREMIYLRKSIWPLREMIASMQRVEHPLISQSTQLYLRDVYDHTVRIIETIEAQRELLSELTDIYLNANSNKMNEVMKVLTIISSLFIPVTFLVGVYGMNFKYMPELDQQWAYPALWIIMLLVIGGMLVYFKKKGWLQ